MPIRTITDEEMQVLRGTNDPSDQTIRDSYFVSSDHRPSSDIDITIIAGDASSSSIDLPLLLMRFHNRDACAGNFGINFFNAVKAGHDGISCGKDFWEVNRTGGSSGRTSNPFDDNLLKYMHEYHASSPRKTSSCKIIQNIDCYTVYWLCAQKKGSLTPKKFSYSPPRIGGNFKVTSKAFTRFPFLKHFAKHKAIAALILEDINDELGIGIASHSAAAEIINLSQGWDILNNIGASELTSPVVEDLIALSYNDFNKHSIVAYDVGYHKDVFGDKQPSLENKVVFGITQQGKGHGRGGKDTSLFHYALLDWGDNKKFRRVILLNRQIIQPNQRATQATLDNWLTQNPHMLNVYRQAQAANNRDLRASRGVSRRARGLNT